MSATRSRLWSAVAVIIGVVPAVVIFQYVFSDPSGTFASLTVRLILTAVVYLVFGAAFGFIGPARSWHWGLEVGVPAMIILGFPAMMSLRNGVTVGFMASAGTLAVALIAACLGAWLAARAATARRAGAAGTTEPAG